MNLYSNHGRGIFRQEAQKSTSIGNFLLICVAFENPVCWLCGRVCDVNLNGTCVTYQRSLQRLKPTLIRIQAFLDSARRKKKTALATIHCIKMCIKVSDSVICSKSSEIFVKRKRNSGLVNKFDGSANWNRRWRSNLFEDVCRITRFLRSCKNLVERLSKIPEMCLILILKNLS